MESSSVKTVGNFANFIEFLLEEKKFSGSLEEYLRALWGILLQHQTSEPTWELFASIFETTYTAPIIPFDEEWFIYEKIPDLHDTNAVKQGFEIVHQMIIFQIADLRRMKNSGTFDLDGNILFMGVSSPTKHSWHNLWLYNFLESASRWMNDGRNDNDSSDCTWFDFALFLHLGRIYE